MSQQAALTRGLTIAGTVPGTPSCMSPEQARASFAAQTLAARARTQYVMSFRVAVMYARAGEKNAAIDWLERTYEQHGAMLGYNKMSPELKGLRPDPRFQDLLRRLSLSDDQVARNSP